MVENDRNMAVTWSIRQAAIYEKYERSTHRRWWILIQPPEAFTRQLSGYLGYNFSALEPPDPDFLHISFFLCTENHWKKFINYLEVELTKLV